VGDRTPDRIRQRLVEVSDELRGLQPSDFASKHRLDKEADTLRRQLAEFGGDSEIQRQWAERAARKSSHTVVGDVEVAKAAIVSPHESGGSS
jgi:hypothetical protein